MKYEAEEKKKQDDEFNEKCKKIEELKKSQDDKSE